MADFEVLAPGGHQHLVDKIKEQLAMKADASLASAVEKVVENQPTAVLGGTALSAADAYAAPPVSLTVDGRSTQDGTPTPDAPVEIQSVVNPVVTFAGKNLFDGQLELGKYSTSTGEKEASTVNLRSVSALPVTEATTYYLYVGSAGEVAGYIAALYYDANWDFVAYRAQRSNATFIVPYGATWMRFFISTTYGTTYKGDICISLSGADDGTYQPTATTVTFPEGTTLRSLPDGTKDTLALTYLRPSTREGWAVYSAELVQLLDVLDMGDLAWTVYSGTKYRANVAGKAFGDYNVMSTAYSVSTAGVVSMKDGTVRGTTQANLVYARNDACADEEAMQTACVGETLLYQLATPITTQLDPIELPVLPAPNCTVWADPTTGLQMEYVRDTSIVIDSLYAEIDRAHAAIAPVEHGTSSANYAVDSYLMLDGTFCKVTSAIATGETIAIGTNVVATTVDAELASLA